MTRLAWLAALMLLPCVGCRGGPDPSEPRAILRAFDEFEAASPTDRPAALAGLRDARCTDATSCADRDECARYATTLVRANELAAKARTLGPVDGGGNGAATADERAVIVSAAEDALHEAERTEPLCHAALRRLHQRAGS